MEIKFSNMKKLFILCAILFSTNIINAQRIKDLVDRANKDLVDRANKDLVDRANKEQGEDEGSKWDDFVDMFTPEDETGGLGYSYSQTFPLSLSLNYTTIYCISLTAEIGFNLDSKKYITKYNLDSKKYITKYNLDSKKYTTKYNLDGKKYVTKEYDPYGCLVISPGFYCKFLSINCGVGFLISNYLETQTTIVNFAGESEDGSTSVDGSISIPTVYYSTSKFNFMLKPSITGYIPIYDEYYYITVNVGYNYVLNFEELNGWSLGVGFQWVIW